MGMRHKVCSFQIYFSGLQGLQVGTVISVKSCTYLSWDWFEKHIHVLICLSIRGWLWKKNGGARIIGGNKVFIFQQNLFWYAGGLNKVVRFYEIWGYWRTFRGGEGSCNPLAPLENLPLPRTNTKIWTTLFNFYWYG